MTSGYRLAPSLGDLERMAHALERIDLMVKRLEFRLEQLERADMDRREIEIVRDNVEVLW